MLLTPSGQQSQTQQPLCGPIILKILYFMQCVQLSVTMAYILGVQGCTCLIQSTGSKLQQINVVSLHQWGY